MIGVLLTKNEAEAFRSGRAVDVSWDQRVVQAPFRKEGKAFVLDVSVEIDGERVSILDLPGLRFVPKKKARK